ncbi:nuclear transport factor 2 family protein [Inquilinus sp. CA228]|uniref:nuclear transport factor 2 family protein n=1 Tax=Inquilinus sp. CA228 TaxID=3455609 RepID=UPI003F8D4986
MQLAAGVLIGLVVNGAARAEAGGCATDETALRHDLEARYEAVKAASVARDPGGMQALMAPDYQSEDTFGHVFDAAAMLRQIFTAPVDIDSTRKTTLDAIKLDDGVAIVEISYEMTTVRAESDGSRAKYEIAALATDRWVCTGAIWYWQRRTAHQMNVVRDGVVIQHTVRDPAR